MSARTGSATVLSASLALLAGPLAAQSTIRVSVSTAGTQANMDSWEWCSVSAGGTCIAFDSQAYNLVAGDTNSRKDVFVRDRVSGTTERVSVDSAGQQAGNDCQYAAISADGRFVVFESAAANLVAGDTNNAWDIFVHDRQSGITERVNVGAGGAQATGDSHYPSISADGRYVAFQSHAPNLVPGDTNVQPDIFVRDRLLGQTERVSVSSTGSQGDSYCEWTAISGDGMCVAFDSAATTLVPGDTNSTTDCFVHDRLLSSTERVSVSAAGLQGDGYSGSACLSGDGRYVAFTSVATTLVSGDTNGCYDIFVRDRQSGTIERASMSVNGFESNGNSYRPSLSADGRFLVFQSGGMQLVLGDTNGAPDIFLFDRQLGTTECLSRSSAGELGNSYSQAPSCSADGRFVAFMSISTNLVAGDTNGKSDIFLRDRGGAVPVAFCMADGSAGACPCGNWGLFGGCDNSAQTGGAALGGTGDAALLGDTLVLNSWGQLPTSLSIVLQGDSAIAGVAFGDGLRCVGGTLRRLYSLSAVGGSVTVPAPGAQSISAQSAALGDVIPAGATRVYQVYYRDPSASFCPAPQGNTWNVTSALSVLWGW